MDPWWALALMAAMGVVGGLANAYMAEGVLKLPRRATAADGQQILIPGSVGNMGIGALAAALSWGLYGPAATQLVIGAQVGPRRIDITFAALMGGILVGISGARWLSSEVDKKIQRSNIAALAAAPAAPPSLVRSMKGARPLQAMDLVNGFIAGVTPSPVKP